MNCNEARHHWNLYHDSEGDAELHFQIGEHLAVCPDCAAWFSQQSRLESLLAEKLGSQPPTPELWDQVLSRCGLAQPAPARRWLWLAGVAACAAALLVAALWYGHFSRASPPDLAKLTAEWHQRLVDGEETVQFHSQSDQIVETYLKERVAFPVRCPPRKNAGFAVQGAGVCKRAAQPIAYLVGEVEETPVSIFILPAESLATFPYQLEAVRRDKTHSCREGPYTMLLRVIDRNAVLVIGQTKLECLEKVLNAYGSYPEPNG
jgi:anti-sigma factor RsiW